VIAYLADLAVVVTGEQRPCRLPTEGATVRAALGMLFRFARKPRETTPTEAA
jgi:hypothetical protein